MTFSSSEFPSYHYFSLKWRWWAWPERNAIKIKLCVSHAGMFFSFQKTMYSVLFYYIFLLQSSNCKEKAMELLWSAGIYTSVLTAYQNWNKIYCNNIHSKLIVRCKLENTYTEATHSDVNLTSLYTILKCICCNCIPLVESIKKGLEHF